MDEISTEGINTSTVDANEAGMNEFMSSMTGDSYQSTQEEEQNADSSADAPEATPADTNDQDSDENTEVNKEGAEDKKAAEGQQEPDKQMFTVKVNKEEKQLTLDEMTKAAQKGMDYDRVKGQRNQLQTENESLKAQLGEYAKSNGLVQQITSIAEANGKTPEQLLMVFRRSALKSQGMSDREIDLAIRAEDAERKAQEMQSPQEDAPSEGQLRMEREVSEFEAAYPDVDLDDIPEDVTEDVRNGMTLLNAYNKHLNSEKDATIADLQKQNEELTRKLKAEEQNRKNFYSSPGSQADSGGDAQSSDIDKFMAAMMRG